MSESKRADSKSYHKYVIDIKEFEILHQIESGGFGLVYCVQNIKTKKEYAAKVNNTHNDEIQYKKMINREIGIMLRCQHPTIIKFIGYSFLDFNNQKNVTIFMDLAKKGSLAELLNKAKTGLLEDIFDNTMKQIILVGIARGMMFLHQQQVIHRDLKPGNILLDENYHPHITDFGLSKFYETGRSMIQSQQCGTSIYMAPEIIEGNKYNGKVDVYSFGIIMYEIITNSPPFPLLMMGKMTPYSFNRKVVEEDYRPVFEYPINKSIKNLIEKCWAKDPKERPTFEEIFNKLAYNIDDLVDDIYENFDDDDEKEITNYYLDDVDVNEVISYANDIDNTNKQIICENSETKSINVLVQELIDPLKKENDELKNEIACIRKEKELEKNKVDKRMNELKEKFEKDTKELDMKYKNLFQSMKQDYDEKIKNMIEMINNDKLNQLPNHCKSEVQKENEQNNVANALKEENKNQNKDSKEEEIKKDSKEEEIKKDSKEEEIKKDDNDVEIYKKVEELENKDQISIENITISEYNNLPLAQQQNIIEQLSKTSEKMSQYFIKINDFILSLLKFGQLKEKPCLEITGNNEEKLFNINDEHRILLHHSATEMLFNSKILDSQDFLNMIKQFPEISIELKYPSDLFQDIYDNILGIQKMPLGKCKLTIAIFITGIEKTDTKFRNNKFINYVKFDSMVKIINSNSFHECESLKQVTIPSSVESIEYRSFSYCSSLLKVFIESPSSLVSIKDNAFERCSKLTEIPIPSSVTSIGSNAFFLCDSLSEISIPPLIETINDNTIYSCKITEILIPSSVKSIGGYGISYCKSLEKIVFETPSSLTSIYHDVLIGCQSLTEITIPSSVTYIGEGFLGGCSKLTKINIQNDGNDNLKRNFAILDNKMIIKKSNEKIDELDTLVFVIPTIETIEIPSYIKKIGSKSFQSCSLLKEINVPSTVTSIGSFAFADCSSLEKISIPSSVSSIEAYAFSDCKALKHLIFKASLTTIEKYLFDKCISLEKISIPSSVTTIGSFSFQNCSSLKQIEFPSSIKLIKSYAFSGCKSLKEITIPSSITSIEDSIFAYCSSLTKITIPSSITSIRSNAFFMCGSLINLTIPNSVYKIEANAFCGCRSITKIIIPSSVTSINNGTFSCCSSLTDITIPSSVTLIQSGAFRSCKSLKKITIPSSVTDIGNRCFSDCSLLEEIEIPPSVKLIGEYFFYRCESLKKIIIPNSVNSIKKFAFGECTSLKQIELPSSLKSIEDNAFYKCSKLQKITIPQITFIGDNVFDECSSLIEITLSSNLDTSKIKLSQKTQVIKV